MLSKEARQFIRDLTASYEQNLGKPAPSLEEIRLAEQKEFEARAFAYPTSRVEVRRTPQASMDVLHPAHETSARAAFYIHGGGWTTGSALRAREVGAFFSEECGMKAYLPEYRLAPECKFDGQLTDCLGAYRAALEETQGELFVFGSSAGGHLALATLLKAQDEGLPMPKGVGLFSPVTYLEPNGKDCYDCLHDYDIILHLFSDKFCHECIASGTPDDRYLRTVDGNFAAFPPVFIACGSEECLLEDSVILFKRMKKAGVKAVLDVKPGLWHSYLECHHWLPEAKEKLREMLGYLLENA